MKNIPPPPRKSLFKINYIFLLLSIFFIFFIPAFNFFVDPYNIFTNQVNIYKEFQTRNDRDTIYALFKLHKNETPDIVMFGDSDAGTRFSEANFFEITKKNIKIISLSGASIQEISDLIKNYLCLNPETKKIIINLKYYQFIKKPSNLLPLFSENLTAKELYKILYSLETTKYSIITFYQIYIIALIYQIKHTLLTKYPNFSQKQSKIEERRIHPYFREDYKNKKILKENFNTLKEIILLTKEKNIQTDIYISPLHALSLVDIYISGSWQQFINFKKEISEITPFYDFAYINHYTSLPINFDNIYFSDPIHSEFPLGQLIIQKLYMKTDIDIVEKITKENIDFQMENQTKKLEEYIKNNKKLTEEYMAHDLYDTTPIIQYQKVQ